jgi:hypothetical protein
MSRKREDTVQRPDLAGRSDKTPERPEGKNAPGDARPGRGYTGEHGAKLPRPPKKD